MRKEGKHSHTTIPLGPVRLRVGGEHHRCMADQPVTLVPVSDEGCGYPWWIGPDDIAGITLESGTAYVLDVTISAERGARNQRRYELVDVVDMVISSDVAIAS